jgi:hypothetical protein
MPTINSQQVFNISQAENGKFIKLDVTDTPELSSFPQGSYALLTYPVNGSGGSGDSDPNTAYQDVPFSGQVAVTTSASQITTNANKGWVTLTIDASTTDIVYIGAAGVTTGDGYILNSSLPSVTVSSDDLSEWYVIGASGGETLYVCGAYIS